MIPPSPAPATLIVESHHWLDNRLGVPLKRLDVTGSRTVSLLLPPGRHSYRLLVHAPMGYVLQVLGTVVEVPDVAELSSVQQHTEAVVTNTGAGPALTDEKPHITSSEKPMQSMPKTGTTQRTTSARFRPCTSGQTKQTGNSVWSILNVQLGDEDTLLTEALSLTPVRMRLHAQRLIRALGQLGLAYSDLTQPDKWMTQSVAGSIWQKTPEQPTVDSDPDLLNELELYSRAQCYLEMFGQKQAELATLLGVSERIPLEEHAKLTVSIGWLDFDDCLFISSLVCSSYSAFISRLCPNVVFLSPMQGEHCKTRKRILTDEEGNIETSNQLDKDS